MRQIRLWFFYCALGGTPAFSAAWQWESESSLVWHGNVTNSDLAADRLSALQWQGGFSVETGGDFLRIAELHAGWQFDAELWPRYQGLNAMRTGPVLWWRHKFGLGPQVPVFTATVSGQGKMAWEAARSGRGGELAVQLQKRWGPDWQVFASLAWEDFRARGHAFSQSGREYMLRADRQLSPVWACSAEVRFRHGDVISYTSPPRPDLVEAGHTLTLVDTFERPAQLLAYYFPADTVSLAMQLSRALGSRATLALRFEYRDTNHNAVRYLNQRTTLGISQRF